MYKDENEKSVEEFNPRPRGYEAVLLSIKDAVVW